MNAVVDTSVFISSLLKKQGVPAQVLDAWRAQLFQIVTSPAIVEEVRTTMTYSRIRRRYPVRDEDVEELLSLLLSLATVVPGVADVRDASIRDPKDEIILACLLEADVDVLITSDDDLLVLGNYRGIPIVTPRQFLRDYLQLSS
ncbi:putative toxin-antitoxin system toxin component, PIN family [Longimicrobium sp.]|uniref:putative toxin-antitoxin system toxin component, PIN family n=1 Tax=Longimicrobium sp. TaxID=2029185 RepID=UPI002E343ED5|nr:putative toxin-antitoxin system toxin component, PIN family [Longimicrobium sp.]HEX6039294.1 putative toxin-antitoxin system toxin component, PIN family [Longimicrobium sp.]